MEAAEFTAIDFIDYSQQLESISLSLDRLLQLNGVLMTSTLFILGVAVAIGVCYFLYKVIKQLF